MKKKNFLNSSLKNVIKKNGLNQIVLTNLKIKSKFELSLLK